MSVVCGSASLPGSAGDVRAFSSQAAQSVNKALEQFVKPEQLDGENSYKCSKYDGVTGKPLPAAPLPAWGMGRPDAVARGAGRTRRAASQLPPPSPEEPGTCLLARVAAAGSPVACSCACARGWSHFLPDLAERACGGRPLCPSLVERSLWHRRLKFWFIAIGNLGF